MYHYCARFNRVEGREATAMDIARMWNGGPRGYKKEATLKYWDKVREVYIQLVNPQLTVLSNINVSADAP